MRRFHVHVSVDALDQSIQFYSKLFGAQPSVRRSDYAKWLLEDPRVNFAISQRARNAGIDHVGFQVDTAEELAELRSRLDAAQGAILEETGTTCCYSRSDKHWVTDPSGIAWESFRTLSDAPVYGEGREIAAAACCIPLAPADNASACCIPTSSAAAHKVCCA